MAKHVVFDVVGTLVSFDAYIARIAATIGPQLESHCITPAHFAFTWMTAAELEFTFLSTSGRYKPYREVMQALFYRTLFMAGIKQPREIFTDTQREACLAGYAELTLRSGARECIELLREQGFTVWCLTTGDVARVRGYFERGGWEFPLEQFVSCDGLGVAKPALGAYRAVYDRFADGDEKWFAAAHLWDVSAARMVGFRGAYCTEYEQEGVWEVFGKVEVVADSLVEMARKIIKDNSI
ncbi:hypothetical protein ASPZODRAFT_1946911 [Penicilliopsis zonata CBS 506.65]|uniref:2-haloalkanoic acid dehalogenase n=1 Tax=Penicilliopsis zonata CBS 506.65 TaxID=1073090 RepID=A0A1L9SJG1_9EURO|nr:hypothetical protein ASPZODRAFT_1946911 [Penicilliopsis zonata CBS 506.65]OJJ47372.1 hypothetical protein ASPZODRAFT_1946911 [Penicilliopsis zonata CBS 506.65]